MLSDRFQMAIAAGASAPAGGEYGPLLHRMANEARYRMRLLPRAALNVRIGIASTEVIRPGVAEAVGMDFTAPGGFELVRPSGQIEASDAIGLLTEGEARNWAPIGDPVTGELRYICDPVEAASLVRFPMLPSGGVPGMNSIPMVTLPKSPQAPAAGTSIRIGRSPYGGAVELTLRELNQHCLIAGLPGFGKTNTSHTILRQLWNEHGVPFLVLDPAKADYGDLIASLSIRGDRAPQRIVLGPESVAFNPFVVPAGSSVAAHAGRVLGAFDAALQISAQWPMGYIMLSRAVFRAYEEKAPGESPTLRSVYAVLGDLIRSTPMDPKSKADVSASLLGRIEYMARGPLGAALAGGPDAGIDWNDLLSRPTVVEFRGFAGPTERSLIFGLLIAGLASVRENEGGGSELRHLTVLEEAHRVLSNRSLVEAEGVRLLAEAIAELRGSGEGFMVIDQTPTALHPTIRKVCGSVVGHRLVEAAEREAVGSALLLEARQRDDLARLPVGRAVVYGAERSTSAVVEVDRAPDVDGRAQPSTSTLTIGSGEPLFCVDCTAMCLHRAAGERIAQRVASERKAAVDLISEEVLASVPPDVVWCGIAHSVGADASTQGRTAVFSELKTLRSALVEVLGKMRMQAKAGASGLDSDLAPAASE